ncbi:hypothetical protein [Kingella sp. (in: b-proteobacteria)]|uniref:hypothetical protein n=1 Tax=Kingella sp. (in: b-proteobacteria) TaxID=2020713 RepID=UPI0026DADE3B|nr:hypothetical protein [Kingella sp. (in: b-proteobacteria)]MDO4656848.1 hypothetical protein [Kingella sp. (in: b-proteobacteria)]
MPTKTLTLSPWWASKLPTLHTQFFRLLLAFCKGFKLPQMERRRLVAKQPNPTSHAK